MKIEETKKDEALKKEHCEKLAKEGVQSTKEQETIEEIQKMKRRNNPQKQKLLQKKKKKCHLVKLHLMNLYDMNWKTSQFFK